MLADRDGRADRAEAARPWARLSQHVPGGGPVNDTVLAGGVLGKQVEVVVQQFQFGHGLVGRLAGQRVCLVPDHLAFLRRKGKVGRVR